MTVEYERLTNIGYNDDRNIGRLHDTYYVRIAQAQNLPYFVNLFYGERFLHCYTFDTMDEVIEYLQRESSVCNLNIVWYVDFSQVYR